MNSIDNSLFGHMLVEKKQCIPTDTPLAKYIENTCQDLLTLIAKAKGKVLNSLYDEENQQITQFYENVTDFIGTIKTIEERLKKDYGIFI